MKTADVSEHDEEGAGNPGPLVDKKALGAEAELGNKMLGELIKHVGDDWDRWDGMIRGLRALVLLAQLEADTSDMKAQAYRDAMGRLLSLKKYANYASLTKQLRSDCYKLMGKIDEITLWYHAQPGDFKMRIKHPQGVIRYVPKTLLPTTGKLTGHNRPRPSKKPKPIDPEIERLRKMLIAVINEFVLPTAPVKAGLLLAKLHPADLDDPVDDIAPENEGDEAAEED